MSFFSSCLNSKLFSVPDVSSSTESSFYLHLIHSTCLPFAFFFSLCCSSSISFLLSLPLCYFPHFPSLSLSQGFFLALSSLVALLELSQPTAPQVFPGDKQAALVCNYAALARGVIIVVLVMVVVVLMVIGAY